MPQLRVYPAGHASFSEHFAEGDGGQWQHSRKAPNGHPTATQRPLQFPPTSPQELCEGCLYDLLAKVHGIMFDEEGTVKLPVIASILQVGF